MKANVVFSAGPYGFGKTWSLELEGKNGVKSFFLGQDGKVCNRLLQLEPRDVIRLVSQKARVDYDTARDIQKYSKQLAAVILDVLNENHMLTKAKIFKLQPWDLAVE